MTKPKSEPGQEELQSVSEQPPVEKGEERISESDPAAARPTWVTAPGYDEQKTQQSRREDWLPSSLHGRPAEDVVVTELPDLEEERVSLPPSTRSTLHLFDREALAPIFFAVLFLGTFSLLVYVLRGFTADLVISFILVGLFRGMYNWLVPRLWNNRWVASGVTTLAVLLIIVLPLFGIGYTIANEAATAYGFASEFFAGGGHVALDRVIERLDGWGLSISRETVLGYITQLSTAVQGLIMAWGASILSDALAITIHLSISLVMVFYLLVDGPRLRDFVFELSPLPDDEDALLVGTFAKVSKGVVVGNGLGSVIQGLLGGLAMWFFGLSSPVLWGGVMAIFAFLPLVGISIVAIPAALFLFLRGDVVESVIFLIFCTIQGLFVENVVKTKMMGSAMRMHDLLVFLSILGGIGVFGIIGIVYGPLIAMMFITLSDLYLRRYRPAFARRFVGRVRGKA